MHRLRKIKVEKQQNLTPDSEALRCEFNVLV